MAARELSTPRLNRILLARQLLLERSSLPVWRAVESVGGLQTQYAPSGYVALAARLERFARHDLTAALERRSVVQATLMRATIHMVSARDFPLMAAGIASARRAWWQRIARARGLDSHDPAEVAKLVRSVLSEPRTQRDIEAAIVSAGYPKDVWDGARLWVDTVRVPPSGTWERRRADTYALADDWLGAGEATEAEGLRHLVVRYLRAFGPAPVADIASWSGVPPTSIQEAVDRMRLRRFVDEEGAELLDVPGAPLPEADVRAPVRLVPHWEAMLLVHARRTGVLPEEHRETIFTSKNPFSFATFLVDGRVAGTWREERGRIVTEPFGPLPVSVRRELAAEAERTAVLFRDPAG
jgi:DNA glycosylase AlkZ-like